MDSIFSVRNFTFFYPEQERAALNGLDLELKQGEFLVLCGASGCGKTTLLRSLKTALAPHGRRTGEILFAGRPLEEIPHREQSQKIGFVQQSPDNQIVTDKVWHELAFGLESLGLDTPAIRRRVAEMAAFFGIEAWFYKNVNELSGGQKQLLNLASVMVMQPSVLILDEPTGQLDPIAASDFLTTLGRINRELGTTIILTEHRLEDAFALASRTAVMDGGRLLCSGAPREVGAVLKQRGHAMFLSMPTAMRVWAAVENEEPCPVTVGEGRTWLARQAERRPLLPLPPEKRYAHSAEKVLEADEVWFRYEKDLPDALRGLTLSVHGGELLALLGGNGTGKTTSLKILAGLLRPYRGEVRSQGKIALLPQEPQTLFVKKTVREDLYETLRGKKLSQARQDEGVAYVTAVCRLTDLLDRHPYDLSGGEQQRAALAKVLLTEPDILLMDEPTKGLDAEFKQSLGEILRTLLARGVTIVMVSHDIEFCARYAHRCALLFDGGITAEGTPREFFSGNSFYTTSANRMARPLLPEAVTAEDIIAACGGEAPKSAELPRDIPPVPQPQESSPDSEPRVLPRWRRLGAAVSGAAAVALFLSFLGESDLSALLYAEDFTALGVRQIAYYAVFIAALLVFAACISRRQRVPDFMAQTPREKRRLTRRTLAACVLIVLLIPLTLFAGVYWLGGKKYYFISMLILLEAMLPFFLIFEDRRPQSRELVVIAVLCAVGVAGRTVFFMLPQFKPVMALTIIAGVAFGGETGFLVGALTMLASNMLFSQGPWMPWQMFAMGVVGFLAGLLFRKGLLRRSRVSLCVFGALSAFVYGGIMNPAAALMWPQDVSGSVIMAYYITGFPIDCVQAAATWLFLWLGAEPMLEKLDRIKVKYGLL
ncbi:MAG: ATP-binding cassette domain-containing protein [Oscillospiraceae bacterium]|nr:ATP-binding cassette domain-containing protein [Oscillospiraceae bacterium]